MLQCAVGYSTHSCAVLNVVDVELHGDVEAVEEVSPKHQRVLRGVHSMDPTLTSTVEEVRWGNKNVPCVSVCVRTRGDHEGIALLQLNPLTVPSLVSQEDVPLFP